VSEATKAAEAAVTGAVTLGPGLALAGGTLTAAATKVETAAVAQTQGFLRRNIWAVLAVAVAAVGVAAAVVLH
jgi:hypothetical protein